MGKGKIPNIAVTYLEMLVKLDNVTSIRILVSIYIIMRYQSGNTKGGSITVPLTSCLTGLESAVRQLTIFIFICKTDKSKPVKLEVNGTVILPPLVFPIPINDKEEQCSTTLPPGGQI